MRCITELKTSIHGFASKLERAAEERRVKERGETSKHCRIWTQPKVGLLNSQARYAHGSSETDQERGEQQQYPDPKTRPSI